MKSKRIVRVMSAALSVMLLSAAPDMTACAAAVLTPEASGTTTYGNSKTTIDASHTSDGYIMIKYNGSNPKVKIRIRKDTEYTYDLNSSGNYETFPLSDGSGAYSIKLYENVSGNDYILASSETVPVSLSNETRPFLYPNQFCNFNAGSAVVSTSDSITAGLNDPLLKLEAVYNYTINNISYDTAKAASVTSGYLPDVDATLSSKSGICFDFASLMTAMLRAQQIPTKLVIGYAGDVYHAWVSIYVDGQGWVDNIIYFDGSTWTMMDPTYASSKSAEANSFITNPANYHAKFTY